MLTEPGEGRDRPVAGGRVGEAGARESSPRSQASAGRSGPEADARLVGLDAHVGDLGRGRAAPSVLDRELVPAGAADDLLEREQPILAHTHRDNLPALEADADVVEGGHQPRSPPGVAAACPPFAAAAE